MLPDSTKTKNPIVIVAGMGILAIIFIGFKLNIKNVQHSDNSVAAAGRPQTIFHPQCNANTYQGVQVSFISGTATKIAVAGVNNDRANFELHYSIRTAGCDIYIPIRPVSAFQWWNGNGSSVSAYSMFGYPDNPLLQHNIYPNHYYKIAANTQENFTSTFSIDLATPGTFNSGQGYYRMFLSQVDWDVTNAITPARTFYTGFTPASTSTTFTTNWVQLN